MPIVLLPTPQRVHITRENFALGQPAVMAVPPGTPDEITEALREPLEELFPELEIRHDAEAPGAAVRFTLLRDPGGLPADVPREAAAEAYQLQVGPEGVEVAASSYAGWLLAARRLPGLRERDELVGVVLLDWPAFLNRQVDLPWPATALNEAALCRWLDLMAAGRFNRIGLPRDPEGREIPAEVEEHARRLGMAIVEPGELDSARLLEHAALFPPYSTSLPALREGTLNAAAAGEVAFTLSLGAVDAQTALEPLVYGLLFAGECAWNPRKADLKQFRRWYSARRFDLDSRAPIEVVDELEVAAAVPSGGTDTALSAALEEVDLFAAPLLAGITRPEERVQAIERHAAAAMAAMAPLQPDSEDRAAALQGLQWTAQRLKMVSRRLDVAERVRELYRSAYVAAASPRAVSQRLLRAAEILDAEAQVLDEHRAEWHALWRRERSGPYDPEIEARLREQVEALQQRAARLRALRDKYIQTGSLPTPGEEGLVRPGTHLASGIQPTRLPPQPSPAWWPEGGAARVRIEVDCPPAAAGMPWEVQADFRALAGESGLFNIRSARLLPLTETDEAGPEKPCQLVRGGVAFIAEPGRHTYFLYLDPQPGPDSGFREARAGQSHAGARLENRRMRVRISPNSGFIDTWHLLEPGLDLLPQEAEPEEEAATASPAWRLRVLETGPLLVRARAEHADGRIRQFDLWAGQNWLELSVNAPWTEFLLPTRPDLWPDGSMALFCEEGRVEGQPLAGTITGSREQRASADPTPHALLPVTWAAQHRSDGLTISVLSLEASPHATVARDGMHLWGRPHIGRLLLFAGVESHPEIALNRVLAAQQEPPHVRLGIIEERRVREF